MIARHREGSPGQGSEAESLSACLGDVRACPRAGTFFDPRAWWSLHRTPGFHSQLEGTLSLHLVVPVGDPSSPPLFDNPHRISLRGTSSRKTAGSIALGASRDFCQVVLNRESGMENRGAVSFSSEDPLGAELVSRAAFRCGRAA